MVTRSYNRANNYSKKVKSVSFLLHQDHGFELAPYEPIDEEQYNKIKDKITPMTRIEDIGNEDLGVECEGGACPIK